MNVQENLAINFLLIALCLEKSHIWKDSGSWDMSQHALGQGDSRIYKSTISPEQNDKKSWFFACWYKFIEIKSWLESIGLDMVINGCAHLSCRTQKLAISHEEINGINLFLMRWYKFRKALMIGPPIYRGPYKINIVCPSVSLSIHQLSIFPWNMSLVFSDFWHDGR